MKNEERCKKIEDAASKFFLWNDKRKKKEIKEVRKEVEKSFGNCVIYKHIKWKKVNSFSVTSGTFRNGTKKIIQLTPQISMCIRFSFSSLRLSLQFKFKNQFHLYSKLCGTYYKILNDFCVCFHCWILSSFFLVTFMIVKEKMQNWVTFSYRETSWRYVMSC